MEVLYNITMVNGQFPLAVFYRIGHFPLNLKKYIQKFKGETCHTTSLKISEEKLAYILQV